MFGRPAGGTLAVILSASALLAGCGNNDGNDDAGTERPADAARGGEITVTLDDFSISPGDLSVRRGTTITARNAGAVAHNFTVEEGTDAREDGEDLAASSG